MNIKIEEDLKKDVDNILYQLGLSSTDAIRIFFKKIRTTNGMPFSLVLPKKEELKEDVKKDILKEEKNISNLQHFKTTEELFKSMGITKYKK